MLIGREAREITQTGRIDRRVSVLEPFVDRLEFREYARRVPVDLVDRGHVSLAFVPAQIETQILLQDLLRVLGHVRLRRKVHGRLVQTEHGPLDRFEAVAVKRDQRQVVALELNVAAVRVKTLLYRRLLLFNN